MCMKSPIQIIVVKFFWLSVFGQSLPFKSLTLVYRIEFGGTAAAAPPPFRPSDPALCGSCPLVTPYYCRLGDLLCLFCVCRFVCILLFVDTCILLFSLFSFSFVASPSVLWYCWLGLLTCKNHLPYNLYCVGGDVKHCSLTHSIESNLAWPGVVMRGLWGVTVSRKVRAVCFKCDTWQDICLTMMSTTIILQAFYSRYFRYSSGRGWGLKMGWKVTETREPRNYWV